jgi:hypothetical protein
MTSQPLFSNITCNGTLQDSTGGVWVGGAADGSDLLSAEIDDLALWNVPVGTSTLFSGLTDANQTFGHTAATKHQFVVVVRLSASGFATDPSASIVAALKNCTSPAYQVTPTERQRDVSRCDYNSWNVSTVCSDCKAHTLLTNTTGNCTAMCNSMQGGLECKKAWVARGNGCAQEASTACDSPVNAEFGHICQCRAPVDADTVITMEIPVVSEEIGEFVVGTIMRQEATRCYHEFVQQYSVHTGTIQLLEPPYIAVLPLQSYRRLYGAAVASTVEVESQFAIETDLESATEAAIICEAHCRETADEGCEMFGIQMTSGSRALCQTWRPGNIAVDIRGEAQGFHLYLAPMVQYSFYWSSLRKNYLLLYL